MENIVLTNLSIPEIRQLFRQELETYFETNQKQKHSSTVQREEWLDLNELISYDPEKRTKPTWYSKISKGEVPYHKRGKKVYFLKSEIDEWLKAGRKKTFANVEAEADAYLSNNKLGLKHGK